MFSKKLRYYRLKNNLSKKELASLIQVTPMSISHYESGQRRPSMEVIKALSAVLQVRVADFLAQGDEKLTFVHGEFRKHSRLTVRKQAFICASVEEYMSHFYAIIDILGEGVLPAPPVCHGLHLSDNAEADAKALRRHLRIAEAGPVGNLVDLLENEGILVYFAAIDDPAFSGMNGLVEGRPYIVVNGNMSPERSRSTLVHEIAHLLFAWPEELCDKEIEDRATAISGAFLLPAEDAQRELGLRRRAVTKDMALICKEYGISLYMLVKRAQLSGIIKNSAAKDFYIRAGRRNEPARIPREEPTLFRQLVFRAVSEGEISVQKGAELLRQPYDYVAGRCFAVED